MAANISNTRTEPKEIFGLNRITKKRLLELCKKDKLYQTASLNDVLYLHYQGFQCIEGLEDYTELKCLWLECNAISEIQGLENQTKLKCLFLQSNLIKKIENLGSCKELDTINLSQNHIRKIENVGDDVLPVLNTLNISSNYLKDCEDLRGLETCTNLSVLDLSNNRIDDILVVKVFAKMPELKVLVLQGNPVVSKIPQYRKTLILECKKLTYLDSRPVFPKDRACAEAWKRGGYEEERKESERWNRKERRKMRDSVNATIRMRNKCRKPEDHLTLLVSSDSEDESAETKRRRQQQRELDAGVDMESGMWDEVAGNDNKSDTAFSSDIHVSSSTSVISTTDSNDRYSSSNSKCSDSKEVPNSTNNDDKILNVSEEDAEKKVSRLAEKENMRDILKFINQTNKMEAASEELERQDIAENQSEMNESEKEGDEIDYSKEDIFMAEGNVVELSTNPKAKDFALGDCDLKTSNEALVAPAGNYDMQHQFNNKLCDPDLRSEEDTPVASTSNAFTSENDDCPADSYDDTIDAICRVTMNDLSHPPVVFPARRVQLQIETTQDYEPFNEMEEAMKTMVNQDDMDRDKARELNSKTDGQTFCSAKTQSQIEYEKECTAVNSQIENDFVEMSSNMDILMVQLQRDKEQRREALDALFTEKEAKGEMSSVSSGNEAEGDVDEWRLELMVNQWDKETRLRGDKTTEKKSDGKDNENPNDNEGRGDGNREVSSQIKEEKGENLLNMDQTAKEDSPNSNSKELEEFEHDQMEDQAENECEKLQSGPQEIFIKELEEKTAENQIEENTSELLGSDLEQQWKADRNNYESSVKIYHSSQEPEVKISLEQGRETLDADANETTLKHNAACVRDEDFECDPLDVHLLTRASNHALQSFEKEAKELKDLLQKLENENEELLKELQAEDKCQAVESAQESNVKAMKENEEEQEESNHEKKLNKQIKNDKECELLIPKKVDEKEPHDDNTEEICESLLLKPIKPKSYDFPDIESDEDYSYSQPEKSAMNENELPLSNTIRDVIDSNTDIFKTEHLHNFPANQRQYFPSTSSDKGVILKNLAGQPNLKEFNQDTHQSLDNLLDEYKKQQSQDIRQIVDRVYAQKERYDDTIELIDGKLMVVNKDTGELLELPQAPHHYSSDSDADYDTAHSEDEEGACCSKPRVRSGLSNRQRIRQGGYNDNDYVWRRRHNPNEHVFQRKEQDDEESDNDEFYSLDPLVKPPNVYGNIDREFFDKLSLDHLQFSQQNEDRVVQCARSYEELKYLLTLSKEERRLTVEETDLLDKMIERKSSNAVDEEQMLEEAQRNAIKELTTDEDRLLQKMMQRTKAKEGMKRESLEWLGSNSQYDVQIERKPYWQPNEAIKIYEYKCGGNKLDVSWKPETEIDAAGSDLDDDITEIYGADVYNFIHDDSTEQNKYLEELASAENDESKQIKENLNRIECKDLNLNNGKKNAKFLLGEEEKNEIEKNVDIEGIHLKNETTLEKGCEEFKMTTEKNQPDHKFDDNVRELQNVAELPDEEAKSDQDNNDLIMRTINGCELWFQNVVLPQSSSVHHIDITELENLSDSENSEYTENNVDVEESAGPEASSENAVENKGMQQSQLQNMINLHISEYEKDPMQSLAANLHFSNEQQSTLNHRYDEEFQTTTIPLQGENLPKSEIESSDNEASAVFQAEDFQHLSVNSHALLSNLKTISETHEGGAIQDPSANAAPLPGEYFPNPPHLETTENFTSAESKGENSLYLSANPQVFNATLKTKINSEDSNVFNATLKTTTNDEDMALILDCKSQSLSTAVFEKGYQFPVSEPERTEVSSEYNNVGNSPHVSGNSPDLKSAIQDYNGEIFRESKFQTLEELMPTPQHEYTDNLNTAETKLEYDQHLWGNSKDFHTTLTTTLDDYDGDILQICKSPTVPTAELEDLTSTENEPSEEDSNVGNSWNFFEIPQILNTIMEDFAGEYFEEHRSEETMQAFAEDTEKISSKEDAQTIFENPQYQSTELKRISGRNPWQNISPETELSQLLYFPSVAQIGLEFPQETRFPVNKFKSNFSTAISSEISDDDHLQGTLVNGQTASNFYNNFYNSIFANLPQDGANETPSENLTADLATNIKTPIDVVDNTKHTTTKQDSDEPFLNPRGNVDIWECNLEILDNHEKKLSKQIKNDKECELLIPKKVDENETHDDNTDEICEETVGDIIESSYDFPDIESDEDYSYSQPEKSAMNENELPLSTTIRGVIDSINDIFETEHFHNFPANQRQYLPSTSSDKGVILKDLAGQPNLKEFNRDTHQSLDNLLDEYKKQQSQDIRQMVDRVYAQKERYDDTIELIDGKLMVVNKDTGELLELPQAPHNYSSDSDADYDNAHSEDEEGSCCSKPRVRGGLSNRQRIRQGGYNDNDYVWRRRHNPNEHVFQRKDLDDEESDNDEFYSLDPPVKPPDVYGNIDREFFDKLSFDHLRFSLQDEDHVVQCSRSYEELKYLLTLSKEERRLTVEENDLLDKMIERKSSNAAAEEQKPEDEQRNAIKELTTDEDRLLQKMMQRTKAKEGMKRESLKWLGSNSPYDVEIERKPFWQPNEAIKIYEYKCGGNKVDVSWKPETELDAAGSDLDDDITEIYGADVYNFIHDSAEENKYLEELASAENDESKQIKENLNRIECKDSNLNNGKKNAKFLLGEEEKNEIEKNVDIEGIHLKKETTLEKGCEKFKMTTEKNQPDHKFDDNVRELQNVAELPDEETKSDQDNNELLMRTTNGCEFWLHNVVLPQSSVNHKDITELENPTDSENSEYIENNVVVEESAGPEASSENVVDNKGMQQSQLQNVINLHISEYEKEPMQSLATNLHFSNEQQSTLNHSYDEEFQTTTLPLQGENFPNSEIESSDNEASAVFQAEDLQHLSLNSHALLSNLKTISETHEGGTIQESSANAAPLPGEYFPNPPHLETTENFTSAESKGENSLYLSENPQVFNATLKTKINSEDSHVLNATLKTTTKYLILDCKSQSLSTAVFEKGYQFPVSEPARTEVSSKYNNVGNSPHVSGNSPDLKSAIQDYNGEIFRESKFQTLEELMPTPQHEYTDNLNTAETKLEYDQHLWGNSKDFHTTLPTTLDDYDGDILQICKSPTVPTAELEDLTSTENEPSEEECNVGNSWNFFEIPQILNTIMEDFAGEYFEEHKSEETMQAFAEDTEKISSKEDVDAQTIFENPHYQSTELKRISGRNPWQNTSPETELSQQLFFPSVAQIGLAFPQETRFPVNEFKSNFSTAISSEISDDDHLQGTLVNGQTASNFYNNFYKSIFANLPQGGANKTPSENLTADLATNIKTPTDVVDNTKDTTTKQDADEPFLNPHGNVDIWECNLEILESENLTADMAANINHPTDVGDNTKHTPTKPDSDETFLNPQGDLDILECNLEILESENLTADLATNNHPPTYVVDNTEHNTQYPTKPDSDEPFLNPQGDVDILECNLEILDCNEEVIDIITVNAELHYDF